MPCLRQAADPFIRLMHVIDALPPDFRPEDKEPLRTNMPGLWPTIGDLRKLAAMVEADHIVDQKID